MQLFSLRGDHTMNRGKEEKTVTNYLFTYHNIIILLRKVQFNVSHRITKLTRKIVGSISSTQVPE